ncbi:MAG: pilus assembly protein [Ottowia sp.]|nr:pilus assembly protein [Ottowia sp.]
MKISPRIKPFLIHLCISAVVAATVAAIIFGVWYPHPYRTISGGTQLFLMIVSIDVIVGPLITLIISKPGKSWRALTFDYCTIALLQISALAYGTWTMAAARPLHMVFEKDLFRVVHVPEIPAAQWKRVPPGIEARPLTGPDMLTARLPVDTDEKMASLDLAFAGLLEAFQPALWTPYDGKAAFAAARDMGELRKRLPKAGAEIDAAVHKAGVPEADLRWTIVIGRQFVTWTALLDRHGRIAAYLPLDPGLDLLPAGSGVPAGAPDGAASAASAALAASAPASVASAG